MSSLLAKAAAFALSFFGASKKDGDDTVMAETFWFPAAVEANSAPAVKPAQRRKFPKSIRSGNGIKKASPRKPKSRSLSAKLASAANLLFVPLLEESARLACHTPMDIVTAADAAFDNAREKYRKHFSLFEAWRTDPNSTAFENSSLVEAETAELKEILDDFELADFSVAEELSFAGAWERWYMLEVVEFLEGNAVSAAQRELMKVVRKILRVLEKARRALYAL